MLPKLCTGTQKCEASCYYSDMNNPRHVFNKWISSVDLADFSTFPLLAEIQKCKSRNNTTTHRQVDKANLMSPV